MSNFNPRFCGAPITAGKKQVLKRAKTRYTVPAKTR
jgi:hypothetical protein